LGIYFLFFHFSDVCYFFSVNQNALPVAVIANLVHIRSLCLSNCLLFSSHGTKKTLILREIPEDGVGKLLSDKESLAACDVAVFVHDR
jgi:hypothetical protein